MRTAESPNGAAPGDLLELTVAEPAHGGWCVARSLDGQVVFIRHALPGERVRARVTSSTARFARADAVEVLTAAPERVPPPCPYAGPGGCGGCDLQHASLAAQRAVKAAVVAQQLRRIAGLDRQVTVEELPAGPGVPDGLHWRTRVSFAVTRDGTAGLHRHRSREVVPVGDCLIAHPRIRAAEVTRRRWPGARSVDVTVSPGSGERSVAAGGRQPAERPWLTQHAAGRAWRVSSGVFWQVHPAAATVLAGAVLDALAPQPGESALDLYCGAGLFAGVLAGAVGPAGLVHAVEADAAAVRDARANLSALPQVRVLRGDAAGVLSRDGLHGASLAVIDPPRAGAGRRLIELLCAPGPVRRVGYVSCDPATLARDIAVFGRHGWRLAALRAFDAFPMTHHVECLATLSRG